MPDALNVLIASIGVQTIGSPITLKLVFSNIGMPEYFSKALGEKTIERDSARKRKIQNSSNDISGD